MSGHFRFFLVVLFVGLSALGCRRDAASTQPGTTESTEEGPKLLVTETRKNAGDADFAELRDVVFPVRNNGDRPLTLKLVRRSCSCGDVETPDAIPPDGKGDVIIHWKPSPGKIGRFQLTAEFETNDPRQPLLRLEFIGQVKPAVRVSPEDWSYVEFDTVPPGKSVEREFKLFSTTLPTFDVHAALSDKGLTVETKPLEAGVLVENVKIKSGYSVSVRTTPRLPPGYVRDNLTLEVRAPAEEARRIVLPVYAVVENGLFKVTPPEIKFQKASVADGENVAVKIEFFVPSDDESVQVAKVEPAFIKADAPRRLRKGVWEINLRIPPGDADASHFQPDGFFEGRLLLQTNALAAPIPIRIKWLRPEF